MCRNIICLVSVGAFNGLYIPKLHLRLGFPHEPRWGSLQHGAWCIMERGLTATFRDPSPKTPPLSALWALLGPSGLNPWVSGICSPCGRRPRRLPGLEPPLVIGPRENGFPGPALALDEPVHVERSSKHNQISVSHFSAILRCNVFIALKIDQYRQHQVLYGVVA